MLGISPKTITSSSGTATPKIRPAGSLQASLASLRTILPNAARGAVFGSSVFERWAVDSWALESSVFGGGNVCGGSVFAGAVSACSCRDSFLVQVPSGELHEGVF